MRALRAQPVEDDGEVALPQVGRAVPQVLGDLVRRAHEQDDVGAGDVGDRITLLTAEGERLTGAGDSGGALLEFLTIAARQRQQLDLSFLQGVHELDPEVARAQARLFEVIHTLVDRARADGAVREDDRGDQVVLGGEVAEHRALPDARPARDVGHRGVQPALAELRGGCPRASSATRCRWPSHVPGNDFAGTVREAGPGVTAFAVGDEVFGLAIPRVLRPMAGVKPSVGTTARALIAEAGVRPGEAVLVVGATGGVGTAVVPLLAAAGTLPATIGRRYRLDEGPQACVDFLRAHTTGKLVVELPSAPG